jgi:NitT/TauT family transport system ATP-binding protein
MSGPQYLGMPAELILPALDGRFDVGAGVSVTVPDHFVPYAGAANFPWTSHAAWFYSQMVRWGEVEHRAERARAAAMTFRPDVYRAALAPLGVPMPLADGKVEGLLTAPTEVPSTSATLVIGPDGFFDGVPFDPDQVEAYIEGQRAP